MATNKAGARKKLPKQLAYINENCTGCAGSPVCQEYCPVENCMILVKDDEFAPSFGRIVVDASVCIGCKKCTSKGPDGTMLDGCPWNAIDMWDTQVFEATFGEIQ